jgi:hypothetical protein
VGAVKAHYATDQLDISDVSCLVGFAIMTRNDEMCAVHGQVPLANKHEINFQPAHISILVIATSQFLSLLLLIWMPCFMSNCMISGCHIQPKETQRALAVTVACGMLRAVLYFLAHT